MARFRKFRKRGGKRRFGSNRSSFSLSRINPVNRLPFGSRRFLGLRLGDWAALATLAYFIYAPFKTWVQTKIFKKK